MSTRRWSRIWRQIFLARRSKGPSERELEALREIADILIPDSFNVFGYSKETVIEGILKSIEDGPAIIGLKMKMIHKVLKRCYEG